MFFSYFTTFGFLFQDTKQALRETYSFTESDMSIMAREMGVEFAKITICSSAYLIRGDNEGTSILPKVMGLIKQNGGSFDFHAHPYDDDIIPSSSDREVMEKLENMTGQKNSRIVTPNGKTATFDKHGIIAVDTVKNEIDDEYVKALKLFGGE